MRFDNHSDTIQPQAVMSMTQPAERFSSPIRSRELESCLWFAQLKYEIATVDVSLRFDFLYVLFVMKRIGEKLEQSLLDDQGIDVEFLISKLHVPSYLRRGVRHIL